MELSYETLYEFLRKEKSRQDIQELPQQFFQELVSYIKQKRSELEDNSSVDLFNATEKGKLKNHVDNFVQMLNELYDRREKKIINMAINKARHESTLIDTANLLPEEKRLFEDLTQELNRYREGILRKVLKGEEPAIQETKVQSTQEVERQNRQVRFLKPVPKFVGKELEVYGPFEEEDVANLPSDIADILIRKERAEEMK
ncbi:MAG: hypothetical protein R6V53_01300 [Candidatus Woesearchaeota archaeon]